MRHRLEEQYANLEQQHEAAALGMWVFLATEVMFFGTLFLGVGVYHHQYPAAFEKASEQAELADRRHQHRRAAGQQSVHGAGGALRQARRAPAAVSYLALTAVLGVLFLASRAWNTGSIIEDNLIPGWSFDEAGKWIARDGLRPRTFRT